MKKNVLAILAVTGTFSVIYLLYKYKRRTVKKRNIDKAMETDAALNSLEKENILFKVYVNDSTVVRVGGSGEETFNHITDLCKNSIAESKSLEENQIIEDSITALYLASAEAANVNLTELNVSKIFSYSKNSENFTGFSSKDMPTSINKSLNQPDLRFLKTNCEDSTNLITFLSPSMIDSPDEIKENVNDVLQPQNGDIEGKNLVESFNKTNHHNLHSNVNIENGESVPTPNSVKGMSKQCNLNKLHIDNDKLNCVTPVTSDTELIQENHLPNSNSLVNMASPKSEVNCDNPEVLNEPVKEESTRVSNGKKRRNRKKKNSNSSSRSSSSPNNENLSPVLKFNIDELARNEIDNVCYTNSSSENHVNSPPKTGLNEDEKMPKNEIDNACNTNGSSENNGNLQHKIELNEDEMMPKNKIVNGCNINSSSEDNVNSQHKIELNKDEMFPKNEIGNLYYTNSISENNGSSLPKRESNEDQILQKNEIVNLCYANSISENKGNLLTTTKLLVDEIDNAHFTNSSLNHCDNVNLNKNEIFSLVVEYPLSEGTTKYETYPIFEEASICVGSVTSGDCHLSCETSCPSYIPGLVPEPQSIADNSQPLQEMKRVEAVPFNNQYNFLFSFSFLRTLAGKIIGRNGSFKNKVKDQTHVGILIQNHPSDESISICTMGANKLEYFSNCIKMLKERLPEELIDEIFKRYNDLLQPTCVSPGNINVPIGVVFKACVSSVQSVGEVFIQQPGNPLFDRFKIISENMQRWYGDGSNVPKLNCPISENTLAVCKINGEWLRCQVINIENDNALVKLLDVGGYVTLPWKQLRQPPPKITSIPFQASFVCLYGLEPPSGSKSYSKEGEAELIKLVQHKDLVVTVGAYSHPDEYPLVKLYFKAKFERYFYVNKELVDKGYAKWADYAPIEHRIQ